MANCKKYNKAACGHLFKHYERAKDENGEYVKFGNQDIDTSRSHLNYNLAAADQPGWQGDFVKKRCSQVKMQNRADVNVMCSWVVTAPKDLRADETEIFFKESYKFLSERYDVKNVVSAHVHMDETTPHMHFAFVPVVMCKKKNILKVSAKECIDQKELKIFHRDLSAHMEKVFGRDIGILNEATKAGNRTTEQLKRETALKKLAEIEAQTAELTEQNKNLTRDIQKATEGLKALKTEEKAVERQIQELEDIFDGVQLTMKQIEKIQPTKGAFGLRNITLEDVANLKTTAMTPQKNKNALNRARKEITQLKKDNAELQKKVPTLKQTVAKNEQAVRLQDMTNENTRLRATLDRLTAGIEQLPDRERELMQNLIATPQRRRDRGGDELS